MQRKKKEKKNLNIIAIIGDFGIFVKSMMGYTYESK
jgi:hypothetical protein